MLDLGLYLSYALIGLAVLGAIGFAIFQAVNTPGALVKALIGVGVLVVIFGVSYALSSSEVSAKNQAFITSSGSRLIGAGLIMFYIAFFLAIIALIYTEVTKAIK